MGMRIYQLPPAIANQIAAGEVIERPASVVKELLENSLDAGADTIHIDIGYGGLNQIKISDNGIGIVAEDLPLAVAAHATSKIKTLDDLYAIGSMGFRGEALASIASIARLTISSRTAEQEHAMMLGIDDERLTLTPCPRAVGTTVDVRDLFFNAPVRKRFLKGEKSEFQAIESVVKRFALSAPHIALSLRHNNKVLLSLPSALNDRAHSIRMTKLFGSSFMRHAYYLDTQSGTMRLHGWISGPQFQRSQNDRQWVYVNQRMVKDKLIQHALKQSYEGLLHPGRFPACLLYLTIKPNEVDVNVHPTKHEVRFEQPRLVHDFFTTQIAQALQLAKPNSEEDIAHPSQQVFSYTKEYKDGDTSLHQVCEPLMSYSKPSLGRVGGADSKAMHWLMLNQQHVLIILEDEPYLVDGIKLYQRWLQEQLQRSVWPLASRPLLVPVRYVLHDSLKKNPATLQACLEDIGIHIHYLDDGDKECIQISRVPLSVPYLDLSLFLESVALSDSFHSEHLAELMCKAQTFDLKLLSMDERMELNHVLIHEEQELLRAKIGKKITVHDCRMLLDV